VSKIVHSWARQGYERRRVNQIGILPEPIAGKVNQSGRGLGLVEMPPDGFGGFSRDYSGQGFGGGLLDVAEAAEVREQALAGTRAYARDGE